MGAEKKTQQSGKDEMIKAISGLLDDTIAEVEKIAKGDVSFKDLKLQPEENGGMPEEAGSSSDDFKSMKKEEEESEGLEKEIPEELDESKDDDDEKKKDKKDDEDEEEEACKSEESEDPEYVKFRSYLAKALKDLGWEQEEKVEKSEDESDSEDLEKSEDAEEGEDLKKALEARDAEVKELRETVAGLTDTVEKMGRIPQQRRSVSGLKPIRKSETDAESDGEQQQSLNKGEVLDKLLDLQKSGDKRVTPNLISKFELFGDESLVKDILTGK